MACNSADMRVCIMTYLHRLLSGGSFAPDLCLILPASNPFTPVPLEPFSQCSTRCTELYKVMLACKTWQQTPAPVGVGLANSRQVPWHGCHLYLLKHRSPVPNASNAVAGWRNKHKRHTRRSAAQTDTETETDIQIEGAWSTANRQEMRALWRFGLPPANWTCLIELIERQARELPATGAVSGMLHCALYAPR